LLPFQRGARALRPLHRCRGGLNMLFQLAVTIGILVAQLINYGGCGVSLVQGYLVPDCCWLLAPSCCTHMHM
jgi:hypothetical protein